MRNTLKAIKKCLDDKEREEKQAQAASVVKQAEALVTAKVDSPLIVAELNASSNTKVGFIKCWREVWFEYVVFLTLKLWGGLLYT